MKTRNFLLACFLLAGFAACKKDNQKAVDNTADNSMSFTLDGKSYTAALLAMSGTTAADADDAGKTDSVLFIIAQTDSSNTAARIALTMTFRKGSVQPGNYSDTAYASDGISWTPVLNKDDYYQSSFKNYAVIQLTNASSTTLEGTFKGQVVATNDVNKISTITDGKFKINPQTVSKAD